MSFNLIKEMGNLGALAQGVGAGINLVNAQFDAVDRAEFFNEFSRLQTRQMDINAKFMNETVKNEKFTDFAKLPELYNQHVQDNIMPLVNESSNPYAKEAIKDMIMKGMVQDKQALEAVAYTRRASKAYTDMVGMIDQAAQTGDTARVHALLAMGQAGGQFSTEDLLIKTEKYGEKAISIGLSEQMGQAQTVQDWDKIANDILNPESLTVEYSGVRGPEKYSASQTIRERLYNTVLEGKKQWYTGKVNEGKAATDSLVASYLTQWHAIANAKQGNVGQPESLLSDFMRSPIPEVAGYATDEARKLALMQQGDGSEPLDKSLYAALSLKVFEKLRAGNTDAFHVAPDILRQAGITENSKDWGIYMNSLVKEHANTPDFAKRNMAPIADYFKNDKLGLNESAQAAGVKRIAQIVTNGPDGQNPNYYDKNGQMKMDEVRKLQENYIDEVKNNTLIKMFQDGWGFWDDKGKIDPDDRNDYVKKGMQGYFGGRVNWTDENDPGYKEVKRMGTFISDELQKSNVVISSLNYDTYTKDRAGLPIITQNISPGKTLAYRVTMDDQNKYTFEELLPGKDGQIISPNNPNIYTLDQLLEKYKAEKNKNIPVGGSR